MKNDKGISYEELQRLKAGILKLAEIESAEMLPLPTDALKRSAELDPETERWIDDQYMDLGKMFGWRARLRGKIMGYRARLYWFLWELRRS